jgi:4'-phosphopantetheinyl transferase
MPADPASPRHSMTPTRERPWRAGPPRPRLAEGAVHVWRADLTTAPAELGELLSAAERARAERFAQRRHGLMWALSRGILRELLGRYLQSDPKTVQIAAQENGKPALLVQRAAGELSFNLSHSGGLALFTFSSAGAVGVDVELRRRPRDRLSLARRAFGSADAERLQALAPSEREEEFLRLWVRREASLKHLGVGLGGADALAELEDEPWIAELDIGAGAAALALAAAPSELCCWEWSAL